jgi:hypothetical protein
LYDNTYAVDKGKERKEGKYKMNRSLKNRQERVPAEFS